MQYVRSLDGLRAIAVAMVILAHWGGNVSWINAIPFGGIGVDIFFVLSGFLISTILFDNKKSIGTSGFSSRWMVVRSFIVRRTLRIFPIYYLTIFALFSVADSTGTGIRENFFYYLTYTSNINTYAERSWDGMLSHLWSLAVEEQFYLFWPWLLMFVNQRYIKFVFASMFIAATLSNAFLDKEFGHIFTVSCFDAFGMGALLAYDRVYSKNHVAKNIQWVFVFLLLAGIVWQVAEDSHIITLRSVVSLATVCLISVLLDGKKTFLKGVLSLQPLVFVGKISYGIYLYHNFVPWLWENMVNRIWPGSSNFLIGNPVIKILAEGSLLLALSWASWCIVERPINNLKRHFSYCAKNTRHTDSADPERRFSEVYKVPGSQVRG